MTVVTHKPMLAIPSTGASGLPPFDFEQLMRSGDWVGDVKMDGIRAFALWDGVEWKFVNRTGVDITERFPELQLIDPDTDEALWLDGEIVAFDGRFETVLTRDKQVYGPAIKAGVNSHPCRFMAFDVPLFASWPYADRRSALEEIAEGIDSPQFGITVISEQPEFLATTRELGMEGVIAKRKNARYQFGARSRSWVKFKNLHRVTVLIAGYSPGTGSRAHFGAMHMALIDQAGEVVSIGTVGTGFTDRQTHELKRRLDNNELLIAEIECLNRTSGGVLRFPVFKGLRTDVPMLDCTTAQLDTIPSC